MPKRRVLLPTGFIEPCTPVLADKPPVGPQWVHEIKHDGYRLIARLDGERVRLFTRHGYDWTERFSAIAAATRDIRATSFTIDGEAVIAGPDGVAAFDELTDIGSFVKTLRDCTHSPDTLTVAVVGFLGAEADRLLEPREREAARAAMERALVAADAGVRTRASRDLGFVIEWQREAGSGAARLKELFRRSHDVDAVVIFELAGRDAQNLKWRARGFSPDGDCSSPSREQVSATVTTSNVASVRSLFQQIARELYAARPRPGSIAILPFDGEGQLMGECADELQDRLLEAISDGASEANNLIAERRIDVNRVRRRDPLPERDASARGFYGVDNAGLWVRVEIINRKDQDLVVKPRTLVTGTNCRPTMKPLIDFVYDTQRPGDLALEMPAAPRLGDSVNIRIRNKGEQPLAVLCWSVAEDGTAEVMTPLPDALRTVRPRGELRYPGDFNRRNTFTQEARGLFGCFGVRGALAPAVRELWTQAWPPASAGPRELTREEALRILDVMRSTDGRSETSERYRVVRRQ
jgi:hypothetical protein